MMNLSARVQDDRREILTDIRRKRKKGESR